MAAPNQPPFFGVLKIDRLSLLNKSIPESHRHTQTPLLSFLNLALKKHRQEGQHQPLLRKRSATHPLPRPRVGFPTVKAAVGTETVPRAMTVPRGVTSPRTIASPGCQDKPPRCSGHIRSTRAPGPLQEEETSGHNCTLLAPAPQHVFFPFYTGEVRQRLLSQALNGYLLFRQSGLNWH